MPPGDTYPIVLACGMARFDRIARRRVSSDSTDDSLHYFKRVRSQLEAEGYSAHHTTVNFAGRVTLRAEELGEQIEAIVARTHAPKVHIIGHSMGGLDARWMIGRLGGDSMVASLTTIATPHHGSPLAEWVAGEGRFGDVLIRGLKAAGVDHTGAYDLTPEAMAQFNDDLAHDEARNHVTYRAWAGRTNLILVSLPIRAGYAILKYKLGCPVNDGLVPLASARWDDARHAGTVPWDHLQQLGWWTPSRIAAFDLIPRRFERRVLDFYSRIARRLEQFQQAHRQ